MFKRVFSKVLSAWVVSGVDSMRIAAWKSTTFGCHFLANWIKTKSTDYTANWVKSKCLYLLTIEALYTMIIFIEDVQIESESENQLRLGVIYWRSR